MADALKAQGNAAFQSKDYAGAIKFFSQAIELDPSNHVLYSNRSAAEASLELYEKALEDAKKCVELKPDWPKGYSRLGAAYHGLAQWDQAIQAYEQGLQLDPSSAQMQEALQQARQAKDSPPGGGMFGPDAMRKLAMDPRTRPLMTDMQFMAMMQSLQQNPAMLNQYMPDPRFRLALEVMLGIKMTTGDQFQEEMDRMETEEPAAASSRPADAAPPQPAAEPSDVPQPETPQPEPDTTEDDRQAEERRQQALAEKERGNEQYKAKQFAQAIEHYSRALELYDRDISFLTNRAAAHYEAGDFEACIADCDAAVERGRELRADFKMIARALQRKGNALVKLGRLEEAVAVYNKSLTEHRNAETLKRLNEAEKLLKDAKEKAYIDLDKCAEERERGNAAFKEGRFPEAVQHYLEALKRGPPSANPEAHKLYSNLAACYQKLGAYPEGVKAAEKCIELEPSFVKAYTRKANCLFLMKDYDKALQAYQEGLEHDPDNAELKDGAVRAMQALNRFMQGDATEAEVNERRAKAMADPEIQNILMDPVMRQVLQDLQEDPRAGQKHLSNPAIRQKITKLAAAGVIQLR